MRTHVEVDVVVFARVHRGEGPTEDLQRERALLDHRLLQLRSSLKMEMSVKTEEACEGEKYVEAHVHVGVHAARGGERGADLAHRHRRRLQAQELLVFPVQRRRIHLAHATVTHGNAVIGHA